MPGPVSRMMKVTMKNLVSSKHDSEVVFASSMVCLTLLRLPSDMLNLFAPSAFRSNSLGRHEWSSPLPLLFVSSVSLTSAAISMNPLTVKRTAFCPMLMSTCASIFLSHQNCHLSVRGSALTRKSTAPVARICGLSTAVTSASTSCSCDGVSFMVSNPCRSRSSVVRFSSTRSATDVHAMAPCTILPASSTSSTEAGAPLAAERALSPDGSCESSGGRRNGARGVGSSAAIANCR
mmetsp:Transcript_50726/g.110111  ORF Transcript_50726/g.110111 Transcript_50726/m.110111 type:complete len:235 (+) Transcript_50726:1602-2306(+)